MESQTSKSGGWLYRVKSFLKRSGPRHSVNAKTKNFLERLILRFANYWQNCPPLLRYLLASLAITLAGLCSPSAEIGNYRICLCNLGVGVALMFCLFGGLSYTPSIFVGLLAFNYSQHYSLLGGSCIFISFLSVLIIAVVGFFMRRFGVREGSLTSGSQLFLSLFEGILLPVCAAGLIIALAAQSKAFTVFFPEFSVGGFTGRLLVQSLIATVLGILVSFTIFQVFYKFNELNVSNFIHSAFFMIVGLAFLTSMFRVQVAEELSRDMKILQDQAFNVKHALEYQVNLQLRSIRDLEYLVIADSQNVLDPKHAEALLGYKGTQRVPWSMVLCFRALDKSQLAKMVPAKDIARQRGRYRYISCMQKRYKLNASLPLGYKNGQIVDENTPLGNWLISAEDPKYRNGASAPNTSFYSRYVIAQMRVDHNMLVGVCPCYLKDKLVGMVVVGVSYADFLQRYMEMFHTDKIGVRVNRFRNINDPKSQLFLLFDRNYQELSLYSTQLFVGFGNSDAKQVLRLDVSYTPDNGIFLLKSLENFSFYVVLLAFVGGMSNILMHQYVLVDEKARLQAKALDDKERYNSRITLGMSDLLITTDLNVRIVSVNETACKVFNSTESELKGRHFHLLAHWGRPCIQDGSCSAAKYYQYIRGMIKSGVELSSIKPQRTSSFIVGKNGKEVNYVGSFTVMQRDNGEVNIICLFRNVDNEVHLQKMRSDYVATLSHEMRTPLSCIKGTVDMFTKFGPKMLAGEGLSSKGVQMLDVAQRNITKLEQLVNDVLLCDSVDNNTLRIDAVQQPIEPIVRHVVESMREVAARDKIELRFGKLEGEAKVDAMRLDQILTNLIGNAIKYSKSGSEIFVEAILSSHRDCIVFSVVDHGEGIPKEIIPQLFNRFAVVSSDSVRKRGGLGLGLTICRGLVNAHGGEIWVESELGKGCVFKFTLPT
ncbi:MAG: PAS domain-containing sensor histidine kinase [bacterium]|nr:PAS domain-containing sensor histidine kinase [bacterium]